MGAGAQPLADEAFRPRTNVPRPEWTASVARAARRIEREAFVVFAVATYAALLLTNLGGAMGGDGWLTLTAGREVAEHGVPRSDAFTVWAAGRTWIDQQWAAQLLSYATAAAGGVKAALLLNALVLIGAFALALAASRWLGASPKSVAIVGLACVLATFPHGGLRAQSLAYPLFVGVLAVLSRAGRGSPKSALLVLPPLVMWANVHGSVLLGAAIVALFGVLAGVARVARREPRCSWPVILTLAVAPWLCVLASPYGFDVVDYYRDTVGNPSFFALVGEWQPSSLPSQWPFFALAFAGLWIAARARERLTAFELFTLLLTLIAGMAAIRNAVWFVLAVAVLLPLSLDALVAERRERRPRLNIALSVAAAAVVAAILTAVLVRPTEEYLRPYPAAAADAVADVAAADPAARIFANERFADWLIWRSPDLAGRIAFDARFELLTADQLRSIAMWRGRAGDDWRAAARGFSVVVLVPETEREIERALLREPGTRVLVRDRAAVVLLREGR